jgi:predicted nucleic acid-binding protein
MNIFWDTSAVLALVLKDKHGKSAAGQALRTDVHHVTTPLVALEAENKLNALMWQKEIAREAGVRAMESLERLFASRLITVRNVKEARLIAAEGRRLIRHFSSERPHKTMDLIHVASARLLRAEGFFTYDANQSSLAKAAGFQIIVP